MHIFLGVVSFIIAAIGLGFIREIYMKIIGANFILFNGVQYLIAIVVAAYFVYQVLVEKFL